MLLGLLVLLGVLELFMSVANIWVIWMIRLSGKRVASVSFVNTFFI